GGLFFAIKPWRSVTASMPRKAEGRRWPAYRVLPASSSDPGLRRLRPYGSIPGTSGNLDDTQAKPALWSVARYASPTGLLEIMKWSFNPLCFEPTLSFASLRKGVEHERKDYDSLLLIASAFIRACDGAARACSGRELPRRNAQGKAGRTAGGYGNHDAEWGTG